MKSVRLEYYVLTYKLLPNRLLSKDNLIHSGMIPQTSGYTTRIPQFTNQFKIALLGDLDPQ